jgi:hypothetical protein
VRKRERGAPGARGRRAVCVWCCGQRSGAAGAKAARRGRQPGVARKDGSAMVRMRVRDGRDECPREIE